MRCRPCGSAKWGGSVHPARGSRHRRRYRRDHRGSRVGIQVRVEAQQPSSAGWLLSPFCGSEPPRFEPAHGDSTSSRTIGRAGRAGHRCWECTGCHRNRTPPRRSRTRTRAAATAKARGMAMAGRALAGRRLTRRRMHRRPAARSGEPPWDGAGTVVTGSRSVRSGSPVAEHPVQPGVVPCAESSAWPRILDAGTLHTHAPPSGRAAPLRTG